MLSHLLCEKRYLIVCFGYNFNFQSAFAESRVLALCRQIANVTLNSTTIKVNKNPNSVTMKAPAIANSYIKSYRTFVKSFNIFVSNKLSKENLISYSIHIFKTIFLHYGNIRHAHEIHELLKKALVFYCTQKKLRIALEKLVLKYNELLFFSTRQTCC